MQFNEGEYQNLAGAVVHFKTGAEPLTLGACKYTEVVQPIAVGGQLLGVRHEVVFQADADESIHAVPYANVERLQTFPSRVARAN